MKPSKHFEDFLRERIILKYQPDFSRARFLIRESERKQKSMKEFIEKVGLSDINAHDIIEDCYDILMGLIRAKLCKDGFKSSGEGAHEAEVSYLRNLQFPEEIVKFMDQLRYFRNGIKYYGKIFDKEYAEKVLTFLKKVHPRLLNLVKN